MSRLIVQAECPCLHVAGQDRQAGRTTRTGRPGQEVGKGHSEKGQLEKEQLEQDGKKRTVMIARTGQA
jgi:hypothetical protein